MRIIFDISTVARRFGPPAGIGRVERELAEYALKHRPDITFSFYDPALGSFRQVKKEWVGHVIGTDAILDLSRIPTSEQQRLKWRFRLPAPFAEILFWTRRFRHNLQLALERLRLTSASPSTRRIATRLLIPLVNARSNARQRELAPAILPFDVVMGNPLALDPDCLLVSVGNDWTYKDAQQLSTLKTRHNFLYAVLCHDLILIQFPELVGQRASEFVHKFWERVFPLCDLVILTTQTVERDVRTFCAENHIGLGPSAVVRLGFNPMTFANGSVPQLPSGLEPNKYILLVSTLDLRKGHDMAIRVWRRLVAEGIPQSHGFKLVFVGEHMFNTPHIKEILQSGEVGPSLVHFDGVSDGQLAAFYRNAAFCIYPSRYEGFGLPIVEAFGFGKALIASTGGSVPEVVNGLAPCIDPNDENAWYAEIRRWIVDPHVRTDYEQKVRDNFRPRTWAESGAEFFGTIDRLASGHLTPTRPAG